MTLKKYLQEKDIVPEGVKYVYIPIADQHAPTPEQAKKFLQECALCELVRMELEQCPDCTNASPCWRRFCPFPHA